MEKFKINEITGCNWLLKEKKAIVVISHGMAEHIGRYDWFSKQLNDNKIEVWGLNQIGHGDAIVNDLKGHWEKGDFTKCAENLGTIIKMLKEKEHLPIILFGHSMGSFIAQEFIKNHSDLIDGVIFSGSAKTGVLHKAGNVMASLCFGDKTKPNSFLNGLSFGSYNKAFSKNKNGFDWLSRDVEQVKKYEEDPLCGYCCTTGFFKEFLKGLSRLNVGVDKIRKDLPIYIMAGDKDPVGAQGKDVVALKEMYLKNNIKNVEMILYPDGRHEMHNEINKVEVLNNINSWINKTI